MPVFFFFFPTKVIIFRSLSYTQEFENNTRKREKEDKTDNLKHSIDYVRYIKDLLVLFVYDILFDESDLTILNARY